MDHGFDLTHPDLYLNIRINQRELPVALFDRRRDGSLGPVGGSDGANDGTVDQRDVNRFDLDGDHTLTFRDLNIYEYGDSRLGIAPRTFPCGRGIDSAGLSSCDRDNDGRVTGADLVDGDPRTNVGCEDGEDDQITIPAELRNARVDDLVGWNFYADNNFPHYRDPARCAQCAAFAHGTAMAGIIGAMGSDARDAMGVCTSNLVAGMSWIAQITPIVIGGRRVCVTGGPGGGACPDDVGVAYRSSVGAGIAYAVGLDAQVINASLSQRFVRELPPGTIESGSCDPRYRCCEHFPCAQNTYVLGAKYDEFVAQLRMERETLESILTGEHSSVLVTTAGNCRVDLDGGEQFLWPGRSPGSVRRTIVVGTFQDQDFFPVTNPWPPPPPFPAIARFACGSPCMENCGSGYGPQHVDVLTWGQHFTVLQSPPERTSTCLTSTRCIGTSNSAAVVSGSLGLALAMNPDIAEMSGSGRADALRRGLLCAATPSTGMPLATFGGRHLLEWRFTRTPTCTLR